MAVYEWTPTLWDGVDLSAAPFSSAEFDPGNGPGQGAQRDPVESAVVGLGDRFVRSQPVGADWDLHVFLATADQEDWHTLHETFRPEKGLVYLRANDGNKVSWRVQAACRNIERVDALHFLVRIRVPDPVFEENAINTASGTGSGGADTLGIPIGGNSGITFEGVGALAANESGTTLDVVSPANEPDDILIAAIHGYGNQVVSAPAGWTKFVQVNQGVNQRETLAWKRAVASDSEASFDFTKPVDDGLLFAGVISVWRGCVTTGDPTTAAGTPTTKLNTPAQATIDYATLAPGIVCHVVAIGVANSDSPLAAGAIAGTDPTLANRWYLEYVPGVGVATFGYSGESSGASTGARSHTMSASEESVGILFGLQPEEGPGLEGNQPSLPVITITPATIRPVTATASWHYSMRGIIANRSPKALRRYPVQLFSNSNSGNTVDTSALVAAGKMQADGDDLRVWLNGQEVERWLDDVNTITTRLWALIDAPPRVKLTLTSAATAGSPADGGTLQITEDISRLPEQGFVVIDNEAISYQGRNLATRRLETIERGAYGTTAASHSAGASVYRGDHEYVIGIGSSAATAPESSTSRRPAIQLHDSNTNLWYYGDETGEPLTRFYDSTTPDRAAMWRPDHERDPADLAEPLLLDSSTTKVAWKDSDVVAGKEQVSRLVLDLPVPIKAAANAITYDVQQRREMRMRLIGRDVLGREYVLADKWDVDEGELLAQLITPAARIYQLILEAVRAATTGQGRLVDSPEGTPSYNDVGEGFAVGFTLAQETFIEAVTLAIYKSGTPDFSYAVQILQDDGDTLELGTVLWDSDDQDDSTLGTTIEVPESFAVGRLFPAGDYVLKVVLSAWVSGFLHVTREPNRTQFAPYRVNTLVAGGWVYPVSAETQAPPYFRIIHDGSGPVQQEVERLNEGSEASFDIIAFRLDDTVGDVLVPLIRRQAAFGETLYFCDAVITNSVNSEQLTVRAWLPLAEPFVIDTAARTVTWKEGNTQRSLSSAVTPLNADVYYRLEPGPQNVVYSEVDMQSTAVVVTYRGRAS